MTIEEFLQVFDTSKIDSMYLNGKPIYTVDPSIHIQCVYLSYTIEDISTKYKRDNIYIPNGYKINMQLHFKTNKEDK